MVLSLEGQFYYEISEDREDLSPVSPLSLLKYTYVSSVEYRVSSVRCALRSHKIA